MCRTSFSVQIPEHCLRRTTVLLTYPYLDVPRDKTIKSNIFTFSPRGFWKISVFRDVTSCCLLDSEDGRQLCSFETSSVNTRIYQSTRRNIPKCLKILSKDIFCKNYKVRNVNIYKPAFHQMWSDRMMHSRVS